MGTRWNLIAFLSGLLFAAGLAVAGMTDPAKVIGFLDVFGDWDPSLAFVMGGAIAIYAPAYRLITGRRHPLFEEAFALPVRTDIDGKLILGAVAFGIGWGAVGFCPGPAMVSLATLRWEVLVFVAAMFVGMGTFNVWTRRGQT